MPTDAEVIFWIISGIVSLLFAISVPMINNYLDYKQINAKYYD